MCLSEDSLPLISQFKSLIRLLHCDTYSAVQIQITFCKQMIIISQIWSLVQWLVLRDQQSAIQTQIEFYHESILPFPILSQVISIIFLFFCSNDTLSAWRIQQKCIDKLGNLVLIPIRFLFYLFNFQPTIGRQTSIPNTSPFSNWMGQHFHSIPLGSLTLPGTHNSHSYRMRRAVSIPRNIGRCQHLNIYRQLLCGARCLDIRLCLLNQFNINHSNDNDNDECLQNVSNVLWCTHGRFNTVPFKEIVFQITRFIEEYPSEIVVIRCKTEWEWRHKPNHPVSRQQVMEVFRDCDAEKYCAPWNNGDIWSLNVGELAARKWNIILFYEFKMGQYQLSTSWTFTQNAFAKGLMRNIKQWIGEKVKTNEWKEKYLMDDYVHRGSSQSDSLKHKNAGEARRVFLVNGQVTPEFQWRYYLFAIMSGGLGLECDVEFVNAAMIRHINDREIFSVNVWDMDFLHPVLVERIVRVNQSFMHSSL